MLMKQMKNMLCCITDDATITPMHTITPRPVRKIALVQLSIPKSPIISPIRMVMDELKAFSFSEEDIKSAIFDDDYFII